MKKIPEYIAISPVTLLCPRCKATPGIACEMVNDVVELIHLERIEAALVLDEAEKNRVVRPYSIFVDWMAKEADNGVKFQTMEEALNAFKQR